MVTKLRIPCCISLPYSSEMLVLMDENEYLYFVTTVPLKSKKVLWNYWNIVSYRGFSSEQTWNFVFALVLLWPHMFQDKFVFAQLVAFFDRSKFNRIVAKYNGDRYVKHLTCWNQFLAMMFGQFDLGSLFSKSQYFASTEILRLL